MITVIKKIDEIVTIFLYKQNIFEVKPYQRATIRPQSFDRLDLLHQQFYCEVSSYNQQNMFKVNIKSVLKTSSHHFECFDDQKIIFQAGNTLCIKEIGNNQSEFISLNKNVQVLYAFKPATNKKGVFTAEKIAKVIEIALYSLRGQRKSINLSQQSPFFNEVQKIDIFVDEYDNSLVYVSAQNKEGNCILLCDINKGKVLSMGFTPFFEDIKVDSRENMSLSLCGFNGAYNYVKTLRYESGQWQTEEHLLKKIQQNHGQIISHQIIFADRILLAARKAIYICQGTEVLQILQLPQSQGVKFVLKIPKALLVFTAEQNIKMYIEDSDEITFLERGNIPIDLQRNDQIQQVQLSHHHEEVIIRTRKNNYYIWKTEHIELDSNHFQMRFVKVQYSCESQKEGCLSISAGNHYCMLSGNKDVSLVTLEKNEIVLRSEFSVNERQGKNVIASAIHPQGTSFILAFQDRVKIYNILLTKFKESAQFTIKRCQQIIFSNRGQYVACKFGKGVNSCIQVINLTRMMIVQTIKVQAQPIQIIWAESDDELIVSAQNKTIQIYKTNQSIRVHNIKLDTVISYIRVDFKTELLLVSSENKIITIRGGEIIERITPPIEHFHYIFPIYGIYFIVSKNGVLYWSSNLKFQTFKQCSLFSQTSFQLVCRRNYILAYSSFQNVIILECNRTSQSATKQNDIVMVEKSQIVSVFEKVKWLESSFQMLQNATQAKLQEERGNFQTAIAKFKDKANQQIKFANQKCNDISSAKQKQERQAEKLFNSLERNQMKTVHEVDAMFSRKFQLQKEKMLELQMAYQKQKNKYQESIATLEEKYHRQVLQVRQWYSRQADKECNRLEELKNTNLQDKICADVKLLDLLEENDQAVTSIQLEKDRQCHELKEKIKELQAQYNLLLVKNRHQEDKEKKIDEERDRRDYEERRLMAKIEELTNQIGFLQKQITNKTEIIMEKNCIISQQSHQIKDLEKAKLVLSFRANETVRDLEPKQALIERLKSQMAKLDEQFKIQQKKVFQLNQKIEKLEKSHETIKKQNYHTKALLVQKQKDHDQLCWEIFMVINTVDQKDWNEPFIKIYKTHVRYEKFVNRHKKKDNTSQEINRHLMHVQQTLFHTNVGTNKSLKHKDEEIVKKMKENSQLLVELNALRKNEKVHEREKHEMNLVIEKLKRQVNAMTNNSSNELSARAYTSRTGMTKRFASKDAISREKSTIIDMSEYEHSKERREFQTRNRIRSRRSAYKTIAMKNDLQEQTNKYFQMIRESQTCKKEFKIEGDL